MGNPGVLVCGRLRASCTAPLPWSSSAKPDEPEQRATPEEPERDGRADGLGFLAHARTNPGARRCPNEPSLLRHSRRNPKCARSKRTRTPRRPDEPGFPRSCTNEPERGSPTNPNTAPARRTRARQSDELGCPRSCTNGPEWVGIRTNPPCANRTNHDVRQPNEPKRRGSSWRERQDGGDRAG
jgi:hypothetical protein